MKKSFILLFLLLLITYNIAPKIKNKDVKFIWGVLYINKNGDVDTLDLKKELKLKKED